MYFIARNNKIYHYIAHSKLIKRYFFTLLVVCCIAALGYWLQQVVDAYSLLYSQQYCSLQQQSTLGKQLIKKNNKLSEHIKQMQKTTVIATDQNASNDFFKKQLLFVLDHARSHHLKIHSYSINKEKAEQLYIKQVSHLELAGGIDDIMNFLNVIKKSETMIAFYHWSLTRIDDREYMLRCDIGFILAQ